MTAFRPHHLAARAGEHGFALGCGPGGPFLVPLVPGARAPRDLMADLRRWRAELAAWLAACAACGRPVGDPGDRARLRGCNPFCDRGDCPYRGGLT